MAPISQRSLNRTRYHEDGSVMSDYDAMMSVSPMTGEVWKGQVYTPDIVNPIAQELYQAQATNVVSIDQNAITRKIIMESPRNAISVPAYSNMTVPYELTEVDKQVVNKLLDLYTSKKDGQKITGSNADMNVHLKEIATKINIDPLSPPITILCQIVAMSNNIRV